MVNHIPVVLQELQTKQYKGYRWYNISGDDWYPSITSVLGIKPKPFLDVCKSNIGETAAKKELARCTERGTAVHDMCEKYLNNDILYTSGHKTEHVKSFNQIKLSLQHIDNIYSLEAPLYSDFFSVAGRVDCIGEYKGVPSVIDFKTSTNLKTEAMILDYYIQETFYALAFFERTGIEINQIVTIMAVEKGLLPIVWIKSINPYVAQLSKRVEAFYTKVNS